MITFSEYGLSMNDEQINAAIRFNECSEDGQEYDVSPEMMIQLANLGLVFDQGGGCYEQTELMLSVQGDLAQEAKSISANNRRIWPCERTPNAYPSTILVETGAGCSQMPPVKATDRWK